MSLKGKQVLSYLVTLAVYCTLLPWKTALLIMGAIAFHESGHLWAAKKLGFESHGFFLFPFVGGVALSSGEVRNYKQKAFIAIMGPVWGAGLAFVSLLVFLLTKSTFIGQATYWMAFLNLFNLLPLSLMDGGQILESISYSLNKTVGLVTMAVSTLLAVVGLSYISPILGILVAFFGGSKIINDYRIWKLDRKSDFGRYGSIAHFPSAMNSKNLVMTTGAYLVTGVSLYTILRVMQNYGLNYLELFSK